MVHGERAVDVEEIELCVQSVRGSDRNRSVKSVGAALRVVCRAFVRHVALTWHVLMRRSMSCVAATVGTPRSSAGTHTHARTHTYTHTHARTRARTHEHACAHPKGVVEPIWCVEVRTAVMLAPSMPNVLTRSDAVLEWYSSVAAGANEQYRKAQLVRLDRRELLVERYQPLPPLKPEADLCGMHACVCSVGACGCVHARPYLYAHQRCSHGMKGNSCARVASVQQ